VSGGRDREFAAGVQRVYCDRRFDEVFLERAQFREAGELNKTVEARDGTLVQSRA
jgi:hypothetical protein